MRKVRTEIRRRITSEAMKERWARLSDEERQGILDRGRAGYIAKYPERYALSTATRRRIEAGELVPDVCDRGCGKPGAPLYDWDRLVVAGWRCYPCRKVAR